MEANRRFAEKYGFPFPLLCDTTHATGVAYGAADDAGAATARRITYVIGADGRIERAYPKVVPRDHVAQLLGDLAPG